MKACGIQMYGQHSCHRGWRIWNARCPALSLTLVFVFSGASTLAQAPATLFSPAPEAFTTSSHIVSTDVFNWFTSDGGQLSGPWQPLEGRAAWTGTVAFWEDQIKQMMSANIDVIYDHLIPEFDDQRVNLFQALNDLRSQGYDVPKVAPFLDPLITWSNQPNPDLATTAGKDAFVGEYIRFFQEYYSVNKDPDADSYLAQMNGRVELDTWHVKFNTDNFTSLTRADVESRLASAFGAAHPVFNHGVYMITTALNPPTLTFADEQFPQFEINAYNSTVIFNGYTATQLKAGYWDQNVRDPGSQLPRDGGTHYTAAWAQVLANPAVHQVNIESWNEYDEGSGIYRANPGAPFIQPGSGNTNTDTWSTTNDPLQYIKTTAANARLFNDSPDRNAQILWHNLPTQMKPGEVLDVSVTVRSLGDLSWTAAQQFKFGQEDFRPGEVVFGTGRSLLDDTKDEIPIYGGIFRGRPVTFQLELVAPTTPGTYLTHWSMLQENVAWFGQELDWTIQVVPEPNGLALATFGLVALGGRIAGSSRSRWRGGPR
jgi:Ig-like domain from next to BRCA1 gene